MTRTYGKWLNQPYISIEEKQYVSLTELTSELKSPWDENVLLKGTDGMQFSQELSKDT